MLYSFLTSLSDSPRLFFLVGAVISFLLTILGLSVGRNFLPKDQGREFAVGGALSKGKARGAGLILVLVLIISSTLFIPFSIEYIIYLSALFLEMLSGYLDDASETPWGELKKGLIDLVVAVGVSITVYQNHGGTVTLPILQMQFEIPPLVYILLSIILIWASINVTNCSDGVDGLCTSLSLVTFSSICYLLPKESPILSIIWNTLFILLGYLWFNCSPSSMLMGDAGSRAFGLLIALAFLLSGMPFLYLPCAFLLLMDGGLGLLKLTVRRLTHSQTFLQSIRTPLHDQARKHGGWSDPQTVTRFTILQILLSFLILLCIHP